MNVYICTCTVRRHEVYTWEIYYRHDMAWFCGGYYYNIHIDRCMGYILYMYLFCRIPLERKSGIARVNNCSQRCCYIYVYAVATRRRYAETYFSSNGCAHQVTSDTWNPNDSRKLPGCLEHLNNNDDDDDVKKRTTGKGFERNKKKKKKRPGKYAEVTRMKS